MSIGASFVVLAPEQLGLFMVTIGGSGTDYKGVYNSGGTSVNISSTVYVFSEVITATQE